ncbi:MAG: hypothetical protein CM15mP74_19260 [Halieaceae bacterium]|nr:MAG: hypothetical protein CM15mP74_19260 [Halieaceae bacterium]
MPDDPAEWANWEAQGAGFVAATEAAAGGSVDYVVSHAGETAFPDPSRHWAKAAC